jgi:hypothetical protein
MGTFLLIYKKLFNKNANKTVNKDKVDKMS